LVGANLLIVSREDGIAEAEVGKCRTFLNLLDYKLKLETRLAGLDRDDFQTQTGIKGIAERLIRRRKGFLGKGTVRNGEKAKQQKDVKGVDSIHWVFISGFKN